MCSTSSVSNSNQVPSLDLLARMRDMLVSRHWTVSSAESCTSGRIATWMTMVSGASRFYQGGMVAYQNEVKEKELWVSTKTIETHDVVSEAVVREMVQGACSKFGTTFALASTGYAEAWEGHAVEIWVGWGTADDVHTLCLHDDSGRIGNVDRAAAAVVTNFIQYLELITR